jgi:hypothetical protein
MFNSLQAIAKNIISLATKQQPKTPTVAPTPVKTLANINTAIGRNGPGMVQNVQPTPAPGAPVTKPVYNAPTLVTKGFAGQPTVTQSSAAAVAQAQAAAEAAAKVQRQTQVQTQLNQAQKVWQAVLGTGEKVVNGVSHAITAPSRYIVDKDRKVKDQQQLDDYQVEVMAQFNRAHRNADLVVADARQKLANGDISPDDYDRIIEGERKKLTGRAKIWADYTQGLQNSIDAPITGRFNDAVNFAADATKPIGKVGAGAWGLFNNVVEAPKRVLNTVLNLAVPNRKIENQQTFDQSTPPPSWGEFVKANGGKADQATLAKFNQAVKQWSDTQRAGLPGVKLQGNFIDQIKQAWNQSKDQSLVRQAGNLPFSNKALATGFDLAADPINAFPTAWGEKLASPVAKFAAKGIAKLSQASTQKGVAGAFLRGAEKVASPFVSAGKWLNQPIKSGAARQVDNYVKQADKMFKKLTDDEITAWQVYNDTGKFGKVAKGVDKAKIEAFAKEYRAMRDAQYGKEAAAGIQFEKGYRKNYRPTFDTTLKQMTADEQALIQSQIPRFAKSKNWENPTYLRDQLAHVEGLRSFLGDRAVGKLPNQRFLSKDVSSLRRAAGAPGRLWKKAVLKYNPAWYVHNVGWNIPASFLGGADVKSYAKLIKASLKEKSLDNSLIKELPTAVAGRGLFGADAGKVSLGGKLENFSRAASYYGNINKGFSSEQAISKVNRYLFDYATHKRWEAPFRAVNPFFSWQKNIIRLTGQLPFLNPKGSKVINEIKSRFMDKPLQDVPNKDITYTDPETGKELTYNPRQQFEGKIKTPWGWTNAPFLPVLPQQLQQVSTNPILSFLKRITTRQGLLW